MDYPLLLGLSTSLAMLFLPKLPIDVVDYNWDLSPSWMHLLFKYSPYRRLCLKAVIFVCKSKDDDTVAAAALLLPGVMYIYMLHAANHLDDQVSFVLEATLEACLCPPPPVYLQEKKRATWTWIRGLCCMLSRSSGEASWVTCGFACVTTHTLFFVPSLTVFAFFLSIKKAVNPISMMIKENIKIYFLILWSPLYTIHNTWSPLPHIPKLLFWM